MIWLNTFANIFKTVEVIEKNVIISYCLQNMAETVCFRIKISTKIPSCSVKINNLNFTWCFLGHKVWSTYFSIGKYCKLKRLNLLRNMSSEDG